MTGFWQRMGARATGAEQPLRARPPQPFEPVLSVGPAVAALGGFSAPAPQHAEAPGGGTELAGADRLLHEENGPLRERRDVRAGGDAAVPARPGAHDAEGAAPARGARDDDGHARASHPGRTPGAGPATTPSPAADAASAAPAPPFRATTTRRPSPARDTVQSGRPSAPGGGARPGPAAGPAPPRLRHGTREGAAARDAPSAEGAGRGDGRTRRRDPPPAAGPAPRTAAERSAAAAPLGAPEPSRTAVTPGDHLRRSVPVGSGRVDVEALLREQVMGALRSRGAVGAHEHAVVRNARDASPATPPAPGTAVLRAGPATVEVRGPDAPHPGMPAATGPPSVNVRIDRVVVTRAPAPAPPQRPERRTTVDHAAYLARRREQR